ncbi:MAG: hydrogenase maturation protein HypF [Rhodospirillales bacterium]|nr:hydrogenase maturation protein HypF [Rhodospirillales bacterium]
MTGNGGDIIGHVFELPAQVPAVLGVGAFLKNTVCAAFGTKAFVSRDVGNLDSIDAIEAFERMVDGIMKETGIHPIAVAHDLHPDFHSSRYAHTLGVETIPVQHHHAHVAAIMAEHGLTGPVLGLSLDGFGLGPENQSWGGELLKVDATGYERLGHLAMLAQPGGDAAARQPWRMGAAALHAIGRGGEIQERYSAQTGSGVIAQMLERGVNCPPTSSAGRLFDAACGLLGVKLVAEFEGEAPMQLEKMADQPQIQPDGWRFADGELSLFPLLDTLCDVDAQTGADLFHGTLTAALSDWACWAAEETGIRDVAFCGGCFLNAVLREGLAEALERKGLVPRIARAITPGDGAVSLGQAWAAGLSMG